MKKLLAYSLIFLAMFACKDDEITKIPSLEVISISPIEVVEFEDSILVTLAYTDGDGDLGENDPNVKNLFLLDSRNGVSYDFRVQQLSPSGSEIKIQGQLEVQINNTSITDGSTSQQLSYGVYIVDRAGNKSDIVNTPSITVKSN